MVSQSGVIGLLAGAAVMAYGFVLALDPIAWTAASDWLAAGFVLAGLVGACASAYRIGLSVAADESRSDK